MLFLQKATPSNIIDLLAQYDYKTLHTKYKTLAMNKTQARITNASQDNSLRAKINFGNKRLDLATLPFIWIQIWNILSLKGKKCKAPNHVHGEDFKTDREHLLETLSEYNIYNVVYKLNCCLNNSNNFYMNKELYTIYNLLLRFI